MKKTLALVALATTIMVGVPAFADTTTTTTTTTKSSFFSPVLGVGRFFGKVVTMPLSAFRGSDTVVVSSADRTTTIGAQPVFVEINPAGHATIIKETVAVVPGVVTTEVTTIKVNPMHDELVNRRNDLVARATVEQARGQLSASEASGFISRINSVDDRRVALRKNEAAGAYVKEDRKTDTLGYYEEVSSILRSYDRIASDMQSESNQGDKELAATYSYIAL
ncbi:MAG: hypothetical protein K2W82_07960 [Candidatus Obscuribacterales bacterium]|nr:hypothetical protein [Candidatus Obscuribacterales bacterium]